MWGISEHWGSLFFLTFQLGTVSCILTEGTKSSKISSPKVEVVEHSVRTIHLNCSHDSPTRWLWEFAQPDDWKVTVTKKRQFISTNVTYYWSDLKGDNIKILDEDTEAAGNFTCFAGSGVRVQNLTSPNVTCLRLHQTEGDNTLVTRSSNVFAHGNFGCDTPLKNCIIPNTARSSCSNITIDLQKWRGKCQSQRLKREFCPDLDACSSALWNNVHEESFRCEGSLGNLTENDANLTVPSSKDIATQLYYCDAGASWSSFIVLFPIFKEDIWGPHSFTDQINEALDGTSLFLYVSSPHTAPSPHSFGSIARRHYFAENETIELVCIGVRTLFMEGFQLRTGENLSIEVLLDNQKLTYNLTEKYHIVKLNVTLDTSKYGNNSQISCAAPVWNSNQSINTFLNISLYPSKAPSVVHLVKEEVNETVQFKCSYNGWPRPTVIWEHPDQLEFKVVKNYSSRTNDENYHPNQTWYEIFVVNNTVRSFQVKCSAENFRGNASDTESFSSGLEARYIIIICFIAICVLVIALGGLAYWGYRRKMVLYAQHKRSLTTVEVMEFYEGVSPDTADIEALVQPYNSSYEVSRDQILLDGSVLGSGQFGRVLKGSIGGRTVAIKTVNPTADLLYFKSLLSELKILQFVGSHPNIVNIIGAHTSDIKNREVFLILDYCANGCLVEVLRHSRERYVNFFSDSFSDGQPKWPLYENSRDVTLNTGNLILFAREIAKAMDHLASKNVIHGDLAARNVLVTADLHAKVCDFGLSKQLRHYTVYVQKLDCPLPLRWMAIESLQDMEFSLASDKWSYGVCLWEIFSLAEIPYSGVQWGFDSYKMLQEGYRMSKPPCSNDPIHQLMLQCWSAKPQERPSYQYIINQLGKEEEMLT